MAERKLERQLIVDYQTLLAELAQGLRQDNYDSAVELAELSALVRGFGYVKARNLESQRLRQRRLLRAFRSEGISVVNVFESAA